jgi:hypothetical protein
MIDGQPEIAMVGDLGPGHGSAHVVLVHVASCERFGFGSLSHW